MESVILLIMGTEKVRLKTRKPRNYRTFSKFSYLLKSQSQKRLGDDWISPLVKSKPSGIEISAKLNKSPRDFNAQSFAFALHTHISDLVMEKSVLKALSQCNLQLLYILHFFSLLIFKKICCFLHWIQSVSPHFYVTLYYNGSPYILNG